MKIRLFTTLLTLILSGGIVSANAAQIDGLWEARYEKSNTPSSHVRISTLSNGQVQGVIEKAYPRPGAKNQSPTCEACAGANKNKPYVGMRVLWGMKPDGSNSWKGGHLYDPDVDKEYAGNMKLSKDGNTLKLRGYVFNPALGETVTWTRIKE